MYKVILVDDEKAIRQGLKAIIDWQRTASRLSGKAGQRPGGDAPAPGSLKPDLMVMDVRMPGMDGLQVIEEIRKTDKECQFIILRAMPTPVRQARDFMGSERLFAQASRYG